MTANRTPPLALVAVAGVVTALLTPLQGQTTRQFQSLDNQIIVTTQRHFDDWERPEGTVEITAGGELMPKRWNRDTDATDSIVDFLRYELEASAADPITFKVQERLQGRSPSSVRLADAVVDAGSNVGDVANILDGIDTTFWEPALLSGDVDRDVIPALWWFTVDLGRVVFIKKIILKFPPREDLGDPFYVYDVLVSDGRKPISAPTPSSPPDFFPALISLEPNTNDRVVEIDLRGVVGRGVPRVESGAARREVEARDDVDESALGSETDDMATLVGRFVQVVIQGSRLDRAEEVSQAEYEQLESADAGAIDYHKKLDDGSELPVPEETYFERLSEEERGSIRYFRRERPRLAELEVISEGDDVAHGIFRREGSITSPDSRTGGILLDSNVETAHLLLLSSDPVVSFEPTQSVIFDLGSDFWLDSHRMTYVYPTDGYTFGDYTLEVSDGTREPDNSFKWSTVTEREQTAVLGGVVGKITEGNNFPAVAARLLKLQWNVQPRPERLVANPSEFQLFGAGFQPKVVLTSGRIPLGSSRNLVSIEWDADTPPGTRVQLQTRTGNTFFPDTLYYHGDNIRLYEGGADEYYNNRNRRDRGDKIRIWVDGPDWEDSFSSFYEDDTGSPITSASPREYVRIRATLTSDDPELHATLEEVRLNFADPVSSVLRGEITPARVDTLGIPRDLSLYIKPEEIVGDGFDQLLLTSPSDMEMTFGGLYGGTAADFEGEVIDLEQLRIADAQLVSDGADSLLVTFPVIESRSRIELLRLDVSTTLFTISAPLGAALRLGDDGFWQRVDAGNATETAADNTLTLIAVPENHEIVRGLRVVPPAFTPNNDTVNDVASFEFDVVLVRESSAVEVEIYDLSGRRVRLLSEQRPTTTGAYGITWDGTDQSGNLVPPGLYAARIRVDTNTSGAGLDQGDLLRTVAVIY